MAGLDDLFAQIPTRDIANRLGVDEDELNSTIQTLVPVLVGGLQQNAQDPDYASRIESAASTHAASGLLDTGVRVDQVDESDGRNAIAEIFGGNDTGQVASALAGGGAGDTNLIKQLLPILAPIVLAYIGKQLAHGGGVPAGNAPRQQTAPSGGLGDVLGSILGGGSGGGSNPLGSILGSVLGGGSRGGLGDILGKLLGGRKKE